MQKIRIRPGGKVLGMTLDISIMKGKASLPAWKAHVKQNKKVVAEIQGVAAVAITYVPRSYLALLPEG